MKPLTLTIMLGTLAAGCGPEFLVIPQGGAPHVTANAQGVYMSAFADQWNADPHDLANWLTPIAVDLYNGTNQEIRVSLADFSLIGQDGQRLQALNPFSEPLASLDDHPVDDLALHTGPLLASAGPTVVAWRGGGHGGGHFGGGHWGGGHSTGHWGGGHWGSGRYWGGRHWGGGPRWGAGFRVSVGLRHYYGPGVLYWSGPWLYPYSTGAWGYGPPPSDVFEYALPEGVLQPGAHINGFLYFRKATGPDVRTIQLAWRPAEARTGAVVGDAAVALDVVHR